MPKFFDLLNTLKSINVDMDDVAVKLDNLERRLNIKSKKNARFAS